MLVRCPSCSTAYEIPTPARPRRLRCARCQAEWRVEPPEEAETAVAPAASTMAEPAPVAEPVAPSAVIGPVAPIAVAAAPSATIAQALQMPMRDDPAGMAWMLAWVASLAVIVGAAFAGWHGRVPIAHAWPPSLWLFRLLPGGVPV